MLQVPLSNVIIYITYNIYYNVKIYIARHFKCALDEFRSTYLGSFPSLMAAILRARNLNEKKEETLIFFYFQNNILHAHIFITVSEWKVEN